MTELKTDMNPASKHAKIADALAKWGTETPCTPTKLTEIRLDANDKILIPFTTSIVEIDLHYVDFEAIRGFLHCNGVDCLLCRVGRRIDKRDLLPVYDAVDKRVGVLAIPPSVRPGALRPQLSPVLRQLKGETRPLVIINRPDRGRFVVRTQPLPAGIDDGAAEIARFLEDFTQGNVDLTAAFPQMLNEELREIPEIDIALQLRENA